MIALACVQYISYMCAVLYVIRVRVVMTACIIKTRMDSHGIDSLGVTGGEGVSVNAAREPFLFTHSHVSPSGNRGKLTKLKSREPTHTSQDKSTPP